MIEALIVAAGYAAFWSSSTGLEAVVRPLIFVFLLLAAVIAILTNKARAIPPTPSEGVLYAVGLLSAAVALLRSVDYSIYYSMYFITALVGLSVIVRSVTLEKLLDLAAITMLLCVATALLVDWKEFVACLSISINKNGLERFGPLGVHPLLAGYIFGSGSVLLARRAYLARGGWERLVMGGATLLAWAMVLAASARSSVVGLIAAGLFAVVAEFRFFRGTRLGRWGVVVMLAAAVIVVCVAMNSSYLQNILEVNSSTRGIDSGVTGRTDLWEKGLESLTSDPTLVAFGGGLRSSEYSVIGFLTENSYITILLDSGALAGSALILFLMLAPASALRQSRASGAGMPQGLALLPSFFVFLLVQCFFVRYLVGLGNPTALLTLMLFVSLSMRPGYQASLATDRESPREPRMPRAPVGALAPVKPARQ